MSRIFDLRGKNVVVVFAEGFAAEFIEKFSNREHNGLTPNLNKFIDEAVYFDNYFNHTASTFRGLRGQLTSSYQLRRGYSSEYTGLGNLSGSELKKTLTGTLISVPHILKSHGYHSYFLSTHENDYQLNLMLETLEFDKVYGANDFNSTKPEMTDQQLFSHLTDLT